jgi:hypothetical protein
MKRLITVTTAGTMMIMAASAQNNDGILFTNGAFNGRAHVERTVAGR